MMVGPGSYELKRYFDQKQKSAAFIIPRRKDLSVNQVGPGPSTYSINTFVAKKSPVVAFYKAKRSQSAQQITPGPSSYYNASFIKKHIPQAIIGN